MSKFNLADLAASPRSLASGPYVPADGIRGAFRCYGCQIEQARDAVTKPIAFGMHNGHVVRGHARVDAIVATNEPGVYAVAFTLVEEQRIPLGDNLYTSRWIPLGSAS